MLTNRENKMKKIILFLFVILLFVACVNAQPQYYNYNNVGSSSNTIPFGQTAGKAVNWLFLAGDFNQPSPCPSGQQITKIYFFFTTGGSRTYTNLHVLMAQSTITALTSGTFYSGPWDTVYYNASTTFSAGSNSWSSITLDTPFPYDPSKSLVLFVGQCGGAGSGMYVRQNVLSHYRRVWLAGGCPFTPYSGGDGSIVNFGIDVEPAVLYNVPELMYYRFEYNTPSPLATPNFASAPVGNNPAPVLGNHTIGPGGQFDSCLIGNGGSSASNFVNTGWICNLGSGHWTIGFWVKNLIDLNPTYLWGDPGSNSFRCFYGGLAQANNLLFRGPFTDILISCPMPGQHYFHFTFDGTNVRIYRDATLLSTNPRSINMPIGSGFKVGAYSSVNNATSGLIDEFRIYNRTLTQAEITATWNHELPIPLGTKNTNTQVPKDYSISQNFPNPFNPITSISYTIPKTGNVKMVIFDVLGREVATLVNEVKTPGTYAVRFDASNFASGVYMYRIESGNFADTKKMLLVK
jgi:hypothetical protein